MTRTATLLLVLTALVVVPATAQIPDPASAPALATAAGIDRLAVSFFSARFLAVVTTRIEANRIINARLTGAYLQEKTGLVWATADNGKDLDWYAADEYCDALEIADWSDWRLPSIEQLEGLHDRRSAATYKLPPVIRLTGCCPWSETRNGDVSAWNFSFRYRKRFSGSLNYSFQLRALCVRTATAPDVLFYERAAREAPKEEEPRPTRRDRRPR